MNADDRKKEFKKGLNLDDARRRREDTTVQVRKAKKEERLQQRRRRAGPNPSGQVDPSSNFAAADPNDPNHDTRLANLPQMVANLQHPDPHVQLQATTHFRKLLSIERKPPIQQVILTGIAVPKFVEFLGRDDDAPLQFEAAWALTNIASGTSEHTRVVIEHNAVPIFCRLLNSPNDDVREQAVWALGNIAGDSPECRDMVLHTGALQPLLKQLDESQKISMLRNATWTLSNFCRGKPQPRFEYVSPALPTLCQLIFNSRDEEVLTDACWALSYLSDGPNENIQAVINSGVSRKLVELLMHPSPPVQTPALRTVGNIVTGNDNQTQIIINCNALPCLLNLLSSTKKGIRKEACWTISNITAGNKDQIQNVISANILPPLIQLLTVAEFDIRKEAAWAISNATSGGTAQQIQYLVMQGCIAPLCDLLVVADSKIIIVALEGLENILKVGSEEAKECDSRINKMATYIEEAEGCKKLEQLQEHENQDVYEKAAKIVETYFNEDDDDAEDMQPNIDAATGQYAFDANAPQQMNFGGNGGQMDFSGQGGGMNFGQQPGPN